MRRSSVHIDVAIWVTAPSCPVAMLRSYAPAGVVASGVADIGRCLVMVEVGKASHTLLASGLLYLGWPRRYPFADGIISKKLDDGDGVESMQ